MAIVSTKKLGVMVLVIVASCVTLGSAQQDMIKDRDCPFLCECDDYDVNCTKTDMFPDNIPLETRRFFITDSTFDYVPINAFLSNQNLVEIVFIECHIKKIRACAFAELENLDLISFDNSHIGQIEGNAFSNLNNISMIVFGGSKIGEISSFSFHNIENVISLEFGHSTISTIHPFAFLSFKNVGEIMFNVAHIHQFLSDGISRIEGTDTIYLSNVEIDEWQCGIIDTVEDAGIDLLVTRSNFTCDCKLAWLWSQHPNSSVLGDREQNRCTGTGSLLNTIAIEQICPSSKADNRGCRHLLPTTPHTCSRGFDSPKEPIEKVTYPTYFSQKENSAVSRTFHIGAYILSLAIVFIIHWC